MDNMALMLPPIRADTANRREPQLTKKRLKTENHYSRRNDGIISLWRIKQ